jgi:hypothetical protein
MMASKPNSAEKVHASVATDGEKGTNAGNKKLFGMH